MVIVTMAYLQTMTKAGRLRTHFLVIETSIMKQKSGGLPTTTCLLLKPTQSGFWCDDLSVLLSDEPANWTIGRHHSMRSPFPIRKGLRHLLLFRLNHRDFRACWPSLAVLLLAWRRAKQVRSRRRQDFGSRWRHGQGQVMAS